MFFLVSVKTRTIWALALQQYHLLDRTEQSFTITLAQKLINKLQRATSIYVTQVLSTGTKLGIRLFDLNSIGLRKEWIFLRIVFIDLRTSPWLGGAQSFFGE